MDVASGVGEARKESTGRVAQLRELICRVLDSGQVSVGIEAEVGALAIGADDRPGLRLRTFDASDIAMAVLDGCEAAVSGVLEAVEYTSGELMKSAEVPTSLVKNIDLAAIFSRKKNLAARSAVAPTYRAQLLSGVHLVPPPAVSEIEHVADTVIEVMDVQGPTSQADFPRVPRTDWRGALPPASYFWSWVGRRIDVANADTRELLAGHEAALNIVPVPSKGVCPFGGGLELLREASPAYSHFEDHILESRGKGRPG